MCLVSTKPRHVLSGVLLSFWAGNTCADFPLNLTRGATEISEKVYDLHMLICIICVVVCVGVFAVLIYSLMTHRKSKGATPASFHESKTVEIICTTIP